MLALGVVNSVAGELGRRSALDQTRQQRGEPSTYELWPVPLSSPGTCMWWYRSSGASPTEPSPSITMFPASLDACEEREDEEWRPVPIKFMGL